MFLDIEDVIEAKYFTIPFDELVKRKPELAIYAISINPVRFDLGNPVVLSKVNQCLYETVLNIKIEVPPSHLIPTLGIRYAYCEAVTSRISSSKPIIEIGTGASSAIALILAKKYHKEVLATEINLSSLESANRNISANNQEKKIRLIKSKGDIIKNIVPKGKYSALLCYPPLYEEDPTRLEKKRGWKGTHDELIGGGEDGMEFIKQFILELFTEKEVNIELITLMLSSKEFLRKTIKLLPDSIKTEIVQIIAGTRNRFILMIYP